VTFLQLESSFRPRFSKYPKPKSGIGPGSPKTGAKEGYRPRSSRPEAKKWLEVRGIDLGPRRPGAKRGSMALVPLTTEAIGFI